MKTILVVDDNIANRQYLVELLGYKGFQTFEAINGEEALEQVWSHRPDLVICDVLMPKIDGYEFARQIRSTPELADTTIVFFTAHFLDREALELAQAAGVFHVLAKPCEPEVILQKLEKAMTESPSASNRDQTGQYNTRHLRLVTDKLAAKTDELYASNQRLAALIELNLQLASQRDPHQLLAIVCHGARELVGADHAALVAKERGDGPGLNFCHSGIKDALRNPQIDQGIVGDVFTENRTRRLDSVDPDATTGLPEGYPQIASMIAVPLTSLTQNYGWLCVTKSKNSDAFVDEDELLLSILAAQTGRTYENGSLYMKLHQHATMLEQEVHSRRRAQLYLGSQYDTAQILAGTTSFETAVPNLLRLLTEKFGFAGSRLWVVNTETETYRCLDAWFTDAKARPKFRKSSRETSYTFGAGILSQVHESRKPLWIEDCTEKEFYDKIRDNLKSTYLENDLRAGVFIPILLRGEVMGILALLNEDILVQDDETLAVLCSVANQIGQFLERHQQQDSIRRLNRIHAVLSGINNAIVHVHQRDRLFQIACDVAVKQGKFRIAWIGIFDGGVGNSQIVSSSHDDLHENVAAIGNELEKKSEKALIEKAMTHNGPLVVNRLQRQSKKESLIPLTNEAIEADCHSAAAFKLKLRGEAVGLIVLYAQEVDFFDEQEILLLDSLASDISFAMQYIDNEVRLNFLAYNDPVTGLINRTALHSRLHQVVLDNQKERAPFALVLVNINNFRDVNDSLGHHNGDIMLKLVAGRLRRAVWETDIVACLGGDYFAVLLPRIADKSHITRVINKIKLTLRGGFLI
ncbi:MAG: GAF domain-containing protein, partial [Pseudohongiellaceae bacterium]